MKISYKREMKHNYMIIEPDMEKAVGFETDMLEGNHIEGLLRFQVRYIDNQSYYCYEITSRQPLCRLFECKSMDLADIRSLIIGIARILERMEAYLLREEQILLKPEYIYVDPDSSDIRLCLIPGSCYSFSDQLTELLRYLLGKVDHQDKEAVVAAYGLFQESQKADYGMEDLLNVLRKGSDMGKTEQSTEEERISAVDEAAEELQHQEEPGRTYMVQDKTKTLGDSNFPAPGQLLLGAAVLCGGPALLWLWNGLEGIFDNIIWLAAVDFLAAAVIFLPMVLRKTEEDKGQRDSCGPAWRLSLEPVEAEKRREAESSRECGYERTVEMAAEQEPKSMDTVLLRDLDEPSELRKLVSLDKQTEDIPIPYFPFIIGKQGDLVDYILDKSTVSRLHLRIDCADQTYQLTDLNTTNGTKVRGRMLEANEAVCVLPGDEIYIADAGYLFL